MHRGKLSLVNPRLNDLAFSVNLKFQFVLQERANDWSALQDFIGEKTRRVGRLLGQPEFLLRIAPDFFYWISVRVEFFQRIEPDVQSLGQHRCIDILFASEVIQDIGF